MFVHILFSLTDEIVASRILKNMRNKLLEVQVSEAELLVIEFSRIYKMVTED